MSFTLDKWYLDLVADDGTAVVGYAAKVAWQAFGLRYSSALLVPSASPPIEQTSLGDEAWPKLVDGCVTWTSEALGLHGEWRLLGSPIEQTLLTSPAGRIEWSCVMPRARAAVVTPSARYDGLGYAEHLRLTLPPWALPFRTLRWGRHVSDRHSLVWVEWDGEHSMRAIWLDGERQPSARVVASGVAGLTGQRELRFRGNHDLTKRAVGTMIARVAPALAALVAGRLGSMQEHKQLSPSSLLDSRGQPIDDGWAIHELVTW